jgi:hypothetical protein
MELSPLRADQLILSSCAILRYATYGVHPLHPNGWHKAVGFNSLSPPHKAPWELLRMTRRGTMARIFLENASTFHLLVVPLVQGAW